MYKGKKLRITGTAKYVRTGPTHTPLVVLQGYRFEATHLIFCDFDASHESEVSQLSEGQMVTIQGRCEGKPLNLFITSCVVVK